MTSETTKDMTTYLGYLNIEHVVHRRLGLGYHGSLLNFTCFSAYSSCRVPVHSCIAGVQM
jgi:hypothetical protein